MRIGTFGSGNMARALGGSLADAGHEVMIGSREASKASSIASELGGAVRGGTNAEVAEFAEVVLHTIRRKPSDFLSSVSALAGKIIVDLNNRDFPRQINEEPLLPSLHHDNQRDVPDAAVVKCFNTMAMEVFDHDAETLRGLGVSAFVAGGTPEARSVVAQLAEDVGLIPIDMGGGQAADLVEIHGDFIRTIIFGRSDPMTTSQIRAIPRAQESRYGGRRS